jgi:hypothetical protein
MPRRVDRQSKGEEWDQSESKATKRRRGALYVEREKERGRDWVLELKAYGCGSSTARCARDVGVEEPAETHPPSATELPSTLALPQSAGRDSITNY